MLKSSFLVSIVCFSHCLFVNIGNADSSVRFPLSSVIEKTLKNNFVIRVEHERVDAYEALVQREEARFGSELFLQLDFSTLDSATVGRSLYDSAISQRNEKQYLIGVKKQFIYGTSIILANSLNRNESDPVAQLINPDYNSGITLQVIQPLLRGRGKRKNRVGIELAEVSFAEQSLSLALSLENVIAETESRYWKVSYAKAREKILKDNLQLAKSLENEAREKENMGYSNKLDVIQAQAAWARRVKPVVASRLNVQDSLNSLFLVVGDVDFYGEVYNVDDLAVEKLDLLPLEDFAEVVRTRSILLKKQEQEIGMRRLELLSAMDKQLPELNLQLEGSFFGRNEQGGPAVRDALKASGSQFEVQLSLNFPFGDSEEDAIYRYARSLLIQDQLELERLKHEITIYALRIWRNYTNFLKQLSAMDFELELSREQYEKERERFFAGDSPFRDVIAAQDRMDSSKIGKLDVLIQLKLAAIEIRKAEGSILKSILLNADEIGRFEGAIFEQ